MLIGFSGWLNEGSVKNAIDLIYKVVKVIRIIVPIALIVMTTLDITKKVINPSEKEGQKKIMIRVLASIIVFFIPTFIDIVFNIGGIEKVDLDDGSNNINNTTNTTNTNNNGITDKNNKKNDSEENMKLKELSFLNCPGVAVVQKTGDKINLTTDIPDTFNKEIKWTTNKNIIKITPSSDKRSATLEVLNSPTNEVVDITVNADGFYKICSLYVQKTKQLSSLNITNCPGVAVVQKEGNKIDLTTDIPKTFTGAIKWTANKNIIKINPSSDKRSATLEVLNSPTNEVVDITVNADGFYKICSLYVQKHEEIKNVKITNCPSTKTFKNGDIVRLYTDVPTSYNGEVVWGWGTSEGNITVLTETNQEYAFYLSNFKYNTKFTIVATLETSGESEQCTINLVP